MHAPIICSLGTSCVTIYYLISRNTLILSKRVCMVKARISLQIFIINIIYVVKHVYTYRGHRVVIS